MCSDTNCHSVARRVVAVPACSAAECSGAQRAFLNWGNLRRILELLTQWLMEPTWDQVTNGNQMIPHV